MCTQNKPGNPTNLSIAQCYHYTTVTNAVFIPFTGLSHRNMPTARIELSSFEADDGTSTRQLFSSSSFLLNISRTCTSCAIDRKKKKFDVYLRSLKTSTRQFWKKSGFVQPGSRPHQVKIFIMVLQPQWRMWRPRPYLMWSGSWIHFPGKENSRSNWYMLMDNSRD